MICRERNDANATLQGQSFCFHISVNVNQLQSCGFIKFIGSSKSTKERKIQEP